MDVIFNKLAYPIKLENGWRATSAQVPYSTGFLKIEKNLIYNQRFHSIPTFSRIFFSCIWFFQKLKP